MSLETLAAELAGTGVHCKIVLAAEAKDPAKPPYSRKRFLSSLNNNRLAKVYRFLASCADDKQFDVKNKIRSAKGITAKEAKELLVKFQGKALENQWALEEVDDIVKGLFGVYNGVFGHIASNLAQAIQGKEINSNPAAVVVEQLNMYSNALKIVSKIIKRVIVEAAKRGISATELERIPTTTSEGHK